MMVPFGVLVFVSEPESAASAGRLAQVVGGKAEKRNRRENPLPAVFVNCSGAIIPLLYRKLRGQDGVEVSLQRAVYTMRFINWPFPQNGGGSRRQSGRF